MWAFETADSFIYTLNGKLFFPILANIQLLDLVDRIFL